MRFSFRSSSPILTGIAPGSEDRTPLSPLAFVLYRPDSLAGKFSASYGTARLGRLGTRAPGHLGTWAPGHPGTHQYVNLSPTPHDRSPSSPRARCPSMYRPDLIAADTPAARIVRASPV